MTTMGKAVAGVLAIAAMAMLLGWASSSIPLSGEACHMEKASGHETCDTYYLPVALGARVVEWLNHNEGAVLGLATIALAFFTSFLGWSTHRLWQAGEAQRESNERIAEQQIALARVSADAAQRAADTAKAALVSDRRAWVKAKVGVGSSLSAHDGVATMNVTIEMENIGLAPALHTTAYAWLALRRDGTRIQDLLAAKCDELKTRPPFMGFTLFPGDTFPEPDTVFHGISTERSDSSEIVEKKSLDFVVLGCVDYVLPGDPHVHHQTRFIYTLVRMAGEYRINFESGAIERSELVLADMPFNVGSYAD